MPLNHNQSTTSNFINTRSRVSLPPIQRLCPEILTEIFTFCLPDGSGESTNVNFISSRRAPLLLCTVSFAWRSLAISTPRLWQIMYLGLGMAKSLTVDTESILSGIRSWLDRSKSLPLTIYISFLGIQPNSDKAPKCRQILEVLSQEVSRWESFELNSYEGLFLPPDFGILPMLHTFDISNSNIHGIPFTSAPRLKRLELYSLPESALISAFPWDQLVDLTIVMFQTISTSVEIIQRCPRLEWLSLAVEESDEDIWQTFRPPIKHNTLRRLFLLQPYVSAVLDHLTLPALEILSLAAGLTMPRQVGSQLRSSSQFVNFLTRSECQLDKVTLFRPEFGPRKLLECLSHRSCQTLTYLVIQGNAFSPPLVDGELLIRLTYPEDDDDVPICPKLSHLDLYNCTGSDKLFHQLLGKMVHSRCFGRALADQLRSLQICTEEVVFKEDYELLLYAKNNSGLELDYQHASDPGTSNLNGIQFQAGVDENIYEEDSNYASDSGV